jgi:hypothetical protein
MNNLIPVADVQTMAIAVAKSGLFGMKTPEQALALMLVAQSEGLHPARAALEYHIIQGRPSLKADAMLSRFQNAGGKVQWKSYTDADVTGVFSHPSGGEVSIQWTFEMATKAGLTKNPTWKQYPRAMLRARCISEGIRTVYPGVSVGIYTPEEVQDFAPQVTQQQPERDITPEPAAPAAKPVSMPEKVKQAAAKVAGKPRKPDLSVIEGEATTISGNPDEGDLSDIAPAPPASDKPDGATLSQVINAFATKLSMTAPMIEAEYNKPMADWTNADVAEARELFKHLLAERKAMQAGGEI